jgi:hypothetical protein
MVLWIAGRQIGRCTGQHQGSRLRCRRARARWRSRQQRSGTIGRFGRGLCAEIGRRHRHLQNHHLRIRLQAHGRQPGVRRHPQSLEQGSDQRRLERRRRGVDCRRVRSARDRHRWRRFDTGTLRILRRGRDQADLRSGSEIPGLFTPVMGVAGAHRADRADGGRCRAASRSGCGPRSPRWRQSAGAVAEF